MNIKLISAIISAVILFSCQSHIIEPLPNLLEDDYSIYEKVLGNIPKDPAYLVVLNDSTQAEYMNDSSIKYFMNGISGLSEETLKNYISSNQNKAKLDRIPNIEFIFASQGRCGNSKVVNVYLSRVGYNQSKTEAVVTIGAIYGPLAGSGTLFYLIKSSGQWQIGKTMMTWVS